MKRFIDNEWFDLLAAEFAQPYYQTLRHFLAEEYRIKSTALSVHCVTGFRRTHTTGAGGRRRAISLTG